MSEELTKLEAQLSRDSVICAYIDQSNSINATITKTETIKCSTQTVKRKVKLNLTEQEFVNIRRIISSLTYLKINKVSNGTRQTSQTNYVTKTPSRSGSRPT